MNMSFYTGMLGASASQKKLDVVSNNLANINNDGFKPKDAVFSELVNYNLNASQEERTELQAGASAYVTRTSTNFTPSAFRTTGSLTDYAIGDSNAFFKLRDPASGEITYTRDGHFHAGEMADAEAESGQSFYLLSQSGKQVLDQNGKALKAGSVQDIEKIARDMAIRSGMEEAEEEEIEAAEEGEEKPYLAVYTLRFPSRLNSVGNNEYSVREGDEAVNTEAVLRNPSLESGVLESSGTDMAREMTRLIESQRAFSYALKMVQTSDEVEATINQLR